MDCKLIHFYPDLMSLYGSYANVSVLKRTLEQLGNTVTVERIDPAQEVDPAALAAADFLFLGAGTERTQRFVAEDLQRHRDAIHAAAENGTVLFFAGTGMELLGETVTAADGTSFQGLGLANFVSQQVNRRIVGDVYGTTGLFPEVVVGFMNKCSYSIGIQTPLLTSCAMGFGNEAQGGPEGYRSKNVFGSELTGPLLVKNPRLLDTIVDAIYASRGEALPEAHPHSPYALEGYRITAQQLRLRSEAAQ